MRAHVCKLKSLGVSHGASDDQIRDSCLSPRLSICSGLEVTPGFHEESHASGLASCLNSEVAIPLDTVIHSGSHATNQASGAQFGDFCLNWTNEILKLPGVTTRNGPA